MANGLMKESESWDERLLFAPVNTLSRKARRLVVVLAVLLTAGWCALLNGNLMVSWGLPDVQFYFSMANGYIGLVPQPFSSRPLAPLLARWLADRTHIWVPGCFGIVAYVSLLITLAVVYALVLRTAAPRWTLLLIAAVPFWPQLLGDAGLPDPLYAALLGGLLLALERDWLLAAAALMFPLMLARESTSLTLLCLLLVGWRQMRWPGGLLAVGCAGAGALVVRHLAVGSLPNPEQLAGPVYLVGKFVANSLRSVGVLPWSNVYPELCGTPAWQVALHVGRVHSVGVCSWAPGAPQQMVTALLTTFGLLPWLLLALWRGPRSAGQSTVPGSPDLLLRFCLLYGGISFAIAPMLGTWYARLFGYGWPLALVAVPRWLWPSEGTRPAPRTNAIWGGVVVLQLVVCVLADRQVSAAALGWIAGLEVAAVALVMVQRRSSSETSEAA